MNFKPEGGNPFNHQPVSKVEAMDGPFESEAREIGARMHDVIAFRALEELQGNGLWKAFSWEVLVSLERQNLAVHRGHVDRAMEEDFSRKNGIVSGTFSLKGRKIFDYVLGSDQRKIPTFNVKALADGLKAMAAELPKGELEHASEQQEEGEEEEAWFKDDADEEAVEEKSEYADQDPNRPPPRFENAMDAATWIQSRLEEGIDYHYFPPHALISSLHEGISAYLAQAGVELSDEELKEEFQMDYKERLVDENNLEEDSLLSGSISLNGQRLIDYAANRNYSGMSVDDFKLLPLVQAMEKVLKQHRKKS